VAFAASLPYIPLVCWSRGYFIRPNAWWQFRLARGEGGDRRGRCRCYIWQRPRVAGVGRGPTPTYCTPTSPTSLARWFLLAHGDAKSFGSFQAQFTIFAPGGVPDVLAFPLEPHHFPPFRAVSEPQPIAGGARHIAASGEPREGPSTSPCNLLHAGDCRMARD
jgi:hypothetical protein